MNTVIFIGSPRRSGFCEQMAQAFAGIAAQWGDVRILRTYDMDIKPCLGCGGCDDADMCVQDDLSGVHDALIASDVIVFVSPVYFCGFPAPMKALIDRMQRYYSARVGGFSPLSGKARVPVLLGCGGAPHTNDDILCAQLRWVLPALYAGELIHTFFPDTDRRGLPAGWQEIVRQTALSAAEKFASQ